MPLPLPTLTFAVPVSPKTGTRMNPDGVTPGASQADREAAAAASHDATGFGQGDADNFTGNQPDLPARFPRADSASAHRIARDTITV